MLQEERKDEQPERHMYARRRQRSLHRFGPRRMLCHAEIDHREGTHHTGRGQRPCREEDVHVPVIVPSIRVNTKGSRQQVGSCMA